MSFHGLLTSTCTIQRNAAVSLTGTGIAFVDSNPDTLTDTGSGFVTAGFVAGQKINVSGSTSNDGTYTLATVAAGTLTLASTDSLTAEVKGDTVTITATDTYGTPVVAWSSNATGVRCRLAPSGGRELTRDNNLVIANWYAYFDHGTDITEEDRITSVDSGSDTYEVLLVETYGGPFATRHKRATVELIKT